MAHPDNDNEDHEKWELWIQQMEGCIRLNGPFHTL